MIISNKHNENKNIHEYFVINLLLYNIIEGFANLLIKNNKEINILKIKIVKKIK